jgi:alcohol dehydrogenase
MPQNSLELEIPAHLRREFVFRTAGILPPNGILFGFHTINKIGEKAAELGGKQVLLITDENMISLGYIDLAEELLQRENLKVEVFDRVEPEPHIETAETICRLAKMSDFNLIVGLGGGSCLDMAKFISLIATNEQSPLEMITKKVVSKPGLKKILIPTTSGSGSEVSRSFVISTGGEKIVMSSPYALPEIAIIDPGLTLTVPPKVTAASGLDALTHAIDSLMNKTATPLHDCLAIGSIELIAKYLHQATFHGQDLEARYYMSMGATQAMMSLSGTGGLYSHSLSYVLARVRPLAHGILCSLALPYTMAFNLPVVAEKLAQIARAMGDKLETHSLQETGQRAIDQVTHFMTDLKIPQSLKELDFPREELSHLAEICLSQYPRPNNPRPMSKEDCSTILKAMWEGQIYPF